MTLSNDVLIVDDIPENLRVLGSMLRERGYHVRPVLSGALALKACAVHPPDIILLDINMPEMSGYEVCARLKQDPRLKDIPVLFVSALTETDDKVKAFRAGGEDYITKPFQVEEVEARVAAHLSLHRQKQELARVAAELRARNQAIEEDLGMARELQYALLPRQSPRFSRSVGEVGRALHLHHLYRPSAALSGDFFDVFEISENVAGVVICDVMGHGVRAALVAAILRALVTASKPNWKRPSEFMSELNRGLRRTLENTHTLLFASAFYAVVDLANGLLIHANAGHPWPLRLRDGCPPEPLGGWDGCKCGPALGLVSEPKYVSTRTEILGTETILLFTDGLFEVEAPDGSLYDYQALCRAVGEVAGHHGADLCESVVDRVRQFSGQNEFADDVCLISMEIDCRTAASVKGEPATV
jgi:sigma-B regulation protein RsbU (phosphoserine phosphatase)